MSFADTYLEKHRYLMPRIKTPPSRGLSYIVIIPAYMEDRIFYTLESLRNTKTIDRAIEVLVVINYSETDTTDNKKTNEAVYSQLLSWCSENSKPSFNFYPMLASDLPVKHSGAGLARKIGMDEALYRFGLVHNPKGIILSLDADALVDPDYFTAVANEFQEDSVCGGCIFRFAHPIEGSEFSGRIYSAITLYELHLRYYRYALKFSGFPYAFYTIGSCFGVRAGFYAEQGGMNRRKAGEDFYFLNKLFPHRSFCEIKGTRVYPSPRPSSRVPFGTGPVIQRLVDSGKMKYLTYNLQAFIDLKSLFGMISELYDFREEKLDLYLKELPDPIATFLYQNNFSDKLKEIKKNTASERAFYKRFFLWFNGFNVVKFLNFSHKDHYQKIEIIEAAKQLLSQMGLEGFEEDPRSLLLIFRKLDNHT